MSDTEDGHFEIIEGVADDVLAIEAHGHITGASYESELIPLIEERIAKQGKLKLLYVLGPDFHGLSSGAVWDDAKLGFLHLGDFSRVAVVTDKEWVRLGVKMFAPLLSGPVHLFANDEMQAAKDWISQPQDQPAPKLGVDADHKIPPLEDKISSNP